MCFYAKSSCFTYISIIFVHISYGKYFRKVGLMSVFMEEGGMKKKYIFVITLILSVLTAFLGSCGADKKRGQLLESKNLTGKQRAEQARHQQINQKQGDLKMKPIELTSEEFKKKIMDFDRYPKDWKFEGDRPAIVDFYATWCGPCKAVAPIMEQLAEKYAGKIDFYKVDIDQQENVAAAFNVQSIPTILFIPKSGEPYMSIGAMMRSQFEDIINEQLLK